MKVSYASYSPDHHSWSPLRADCWLYVNESAASWRNAPLWNQSSPIQPSIIGANGTATFSAGCGFTTAMMAV